MRSFIHSAGKTAMEEELEPFLATVDIKIKLDFSAMINAPADTRDGDSTATRTALQAGQTMDSTADLLNMEEDQDILGNLETGSMTVSYTHLTLPTIYSV